FVLLGAIVVSLFTGLVFLVKDKGQSRRLLNSLMWRVGLSASLLILLIFAAVMGWIQPHNVGG
ncbi:MAG: twin transmembrane helix small protein, partial [Gammaproteobacteria bacterium]